MVCLMLTMIVALLQVRMQGLLEQLRAQMSLTASLHWHRNSPLLLDWTLMLWPREVAAQTGPSAVAGETVPVHSLVL